MTFRTALVTGGAGFIGSHLTEALLDRGIQVTVLDDLSMGSAERVPDGATLIVGSILDYGKVEAALDGVEVVFHQAARVSIRLSVKEFTPDAEINLMGTIRLLSQSAQKKVKKFIYASSMAVYADSPTPAPIDESYVTEPISPYGISKLASEKYCKVLGRSLGIDTVALRYFNTFGPYQTFTPYVGVITIFCRRLAAGEPPVIFGTGEQTRDFVYVGDVVRANLLAMDQDCGGEVFNVGTGQGRSVREIAAMLCERIRPELRPTYAPAVSGELVNSVADISKARSRLRYCPEHRLEDKIDEVIEWNRAIAERH